MRITTNVKAVVLALVAQRAEILATPDPRPGEDFLTAQDRLASNRLLQAMRDAKDGWVPLEIGRFVGGPPTPSESAGFSRLLRTMQVADLVALRSDWATSRATHVRLTKSGQKLAEKLVGATDGR